MIIMIIFINMNMIPNLPWSPFLHDHHDQQFTMTTTMITIVKVGHSAHAETGETITVEDKNHPGAPSWIDNPGSLK